MRPGARPRSMPDAFREANAEVEGGDQVTACPPPARTTPGCGCGPPHPLRRASSRLARSDCDAELPASAARRNQRAASSGSRATPAPVRCSKPSARAAAAWPVFGRAGEPHRRFGVVRRQLTAFCIEVTDQGSCLGIPRQRRPAQPGLAGDTVLRDCPALHQSQPIACLARADARLGRLAIQLHGLYGQSCSRPTAKS